MPNGIQKSVDKTELTMQLYFAVYQLIRKTRPKKKGMHIKMFKKHTGLS